ncbi:MAG: ABC transporter ATP-binding protein [Myxococcales bacterium]|nr:ABC transporter ATP-binding protein [Myxococcales bacterium]
MSIHLPSEHPAGAHAPAVETKELTVVLGGAVVLENVSICIDEGTFTAILGPNGGGKTTLLKAVLGLVPIAHGSIQVLGRPIAELDAVRDRIGYVPQHLNLDPHFPATVLDVVLMGAYAPVGLFRPVGRRWRDRAREVLRRVGMADQAGRTFGRLSGGQRQRVLIARAMVSRPSLLLLDEPTTGVDMVGKTDLMALLAELRTEMGLTILMVTHDVALIRTAADKVACLNHHLHWHDASELFSGAILERVFSAPAPSPSRAEERRG